MLHPVIATVIEMMVVPVVQNQFREPTVPAGRNHSVKQNNVHYIVVGGGRGGRFDGNFAVESDGYSVAEPVVDSDDVDSDVPDSGDVAEFAESVAVEDVVAEIGGSAVAAVVPETGGSAGPSGPAAATAATSSLSNLKSETEV